MFEEMGFKVDHSSPIYKRFRLKILGLFESGITSTGSPASGEKGRSAIAEVITASILSRLHILVNLTKAERETRLQMERLMLQKAHQTLELIKVHRWPRMGGHRFIEIIFLHQFDVYGLQQVTRYLETKWLTGVKAL
ncbi:uncharacterized protein LOC130933703 [Arachis stenosperma]|uniref:uncharacterized protein LOC130933703 n=1 Tax=Arachis stenosperma TaxID=217475 RepID=UPI0025AB6025|nr:uncharacterized protein LOC130933703 [Arachis stenosperma]